MDDRTTIRVLKALAHPKRFQMVEKVADAGELCCGAIGECFEVAQPTISHHLKILGDAGVLKARREAQRAFISVDTALLEEVFDSIRDRLSARSPVRTKKTRKVAVRAR